MPCAAAVRGHVRGLACERAAKGRWPAHGSGAGPLGPRVRRDPSGMRARVPGGPCRVLRAAWCGQSCTVQKCEEAWRERVTGGDRVPGQPREPAWCSIVAGF